MKKNRFTFINDILYIQELTPIKTVGELRQHIGEVLLMGYVVYHNGRPKLCLWMGALTSTSLYDYREHTSIRNRAIYTEHFLFINVYSKILDINKKCLYFNEFKYSSTKEVYSNAQEFIYVPDKRFMMVYNLYRARLSMDS